jgi:hypothetical protein
MCEATDPESLPWPCAVMMRLSLRSEFDPLLRPEIDTSIYWPAALCTTGARA